MGNQQNQVSWFKQNWENLIEAEKKKSDSDCKSLIVQLWSVQKSQISKENQNISMSLLGQMSSDQIQILMKAHIR